MNGQTDGLTKAKQASKRNECNEMKAQFTASNWKRTINDKKNSRETLKLTHIHAEHEQVLRRRMLMIYLRDEAKHNLCSCSCQFPTTENVTSG